MSGMSSQTTGAYSEPKLSKTDVPRMPFDRGPRPYLRGRLHSSAAWYFGGLGTALAGTAAVRSGFSSLLSWTCLVYVCCLVAMLTVSALYHRVPWRRESTVQSWRRADHAMIAVFIAGTYGPITAGAFGSQWFVQRGGVEWLGGFFGWGGTWILAVVWAAAAAAVVLNVFWITHPRWLDVVVYLTLGWIALCGVAAYYPTLGLAPCLLILAGGFVYTVGAFIYGKKWPNPSQRWFGFHELFHALTVVAAALHHWAIWMVVFSAS